MIEQMLTLPVFLGHFVLEHGAGCVCPDGSLDDILTDALQWAHSLQAHSEDIMKTTCNTGQGYLSWYSGAVDIISDGVIFLCPDDFRMPSISDSVADTLSTDAVTPYLIICRDSCCPMTSHHIHIIQRMHEQKKLILINLHKMQGK